jgi:hypothetical protein
MRTSLKLLASVSTAVINAIGFWCLAGARLDEPFGKSGPAV